MCSCGYTRGRGGDLQSARVVRRDMNALNKGRTRMDPEAAIAGDVSGWLGRKEVVW